MARSEAGESATWPLLLLLSLIAYGSISTSTTLQSHRAATEQPTPGEGTAIEIPARLWQDPLAAVATAKPAEVSSVQSLPRVALERALPGEVAFCFAITQGGATPEDVERRLRNRYAVVSALGRLGYFPDDPDRLWLLSAPDFAIDGTHPNAAPPSPDLRVPVVSLRSVIPFERFSYAAPAAGAPAPGIRRVVVLWLSDRIFGGPAIAERLDGVCRHVGASLLGAGVMDSGRPPEYFPKTIVLGPTGSGDYLQLLRWDRQRVNEPTGAPMVCLQRALIVSPFATIDLGATTAPNSIARCIVTDRQLVDSLVDELALRRALATSNPARVVLVGELDTPYARGLIQITRELIAAQSQRTTVVAYDYLRGLDGYTSSASAADRLPSAGSEKKSIFGSAPSDRPAGSAQFDYLRRLATRIKLDAEAADAEISDIRAIGIFGTDVYDKLLIMQALRPEFPGVVFFTTDLDQRLLLPDQNTWTRNLVVASAFGLQLGEKLQGRTPPFRDSYQTSVYWGMLLALARSDEALARALDLADSATSPNPADPDAAPHPPDTRLPDRPRGPHVYEVGRTEPYDVTVIPEPSPFFPETPRLERTGGVKRSGLIGMAAFLLLCFLVFAYYNGSRHTLADAPRPAADICCAAGADMRLPVWLIRFTRSDWYRCITGVLISGGVIALFSGACYWVISLVPASAGGEPFTLFQGISIWPTDIIRIAVVGLAISWVFMLLRRWSASAREIEAKYWLPTPLNPLSPRVSPHSWFRRVPYAVIKFGHIFDWYYTQRPVNANELWAAYAVRAQPSIQLTRVFLLTAIYYLFCHMLFRGFAIPHNPARGAWAASVDRLVVIVSTTASAFLTLLVWDATRLCDRFTRFLVSREPTRYSEPTCACALEARGLDADLAPSWLDIRIIAARTDSITRAIYYPIVTLVMLLVARNRVFDDWHWSSPVVIALGANAAVMLYAGWILRRSAERARARELERLRTLRAAADHRGDSRRADTIDKLITEISEIRDGAFAPWKQQPVFGSILIPFGGAGVIGAIDFISKHFA